MSYPSSVKRSLGLLGTGLATLVAALAVTTAPAETAAPIATAPIANASAALAAPDNYTPRAGALFNKPIGTRAQQYRLFTHINRTINSAPARSVIRIAVFSFSDMATANNLIAAYHRGVNVKLVFDAHGFWDAEMKLKRVLGSNPDKPSFAVFCSKSCRGTSGEMHGKGFQFWRAGGARLITMIGSNNMTSHNAERQWSDLDTMVGDREIYRTFRTWFGQLKYDTPVENPRIVGFSEENLVLFTPQNDIAIDGDPALKALGPVYCNVPTYETDPVTGDPVLDPVTGEPVVKSVYLTRVLISAHAWYGPRGYTIAQRVADLAKEGCRVKVFYGEAFGTEIHKLLKESGVELATSRHTGVKTHQKLLIVRGGYGGNPDGNYAWTGSHNWSPWALKIDDVILRTDNLDAVNAYTRHFDYMFKYA